MVLPPDHADRVIAQHRSRVEKVAMMGTLLLITSAGWWLFPAMDGSVELLPRMGPVIAMFVAALMLMDLIDHGPVERSRIAIASGLAWPMVIAMAIDSFGDGDRTLASAILILVAISLLLHWRNALGGSLSTRRLRAFSGLAGIAIGIAIVISLGLELLIAVVFALACVGMVTPDLMAKDDVHKERKKFANELDEAEARMLELRSKNSGLEQASSLIQQAREAGWKDPARGMVLIEEADREAKRIMEMAVDIDAIRSDSLSAVEKAEEIAPVVQGPRRAFTMGDREAGHGSLREAESLYRLAKTKAGAIEENWQLAAESIATAEKAIAAKSGSASDSIRGILTAAKEAMDAEEPAEALHIASSIPAHIESLEASSGEAEVAIADAEAALKSAEGELALANVERLTEAKEALAKGDVPLAKGLADSLAREVRETSDAMQEVQRALRQKKQISARFPSGQANQFWQSRLEEVEAAASSGAWTNASQSLTSLTNDLATYESEAGEAKELLDFVQSEWSELRRRLDSSSIAPTDESRRATEATVNKAIQALDSGQIQDCLTALGKADELLEGLRRRVV
ncbi:MAG: hypothetical protein MKZ68_02990 [Candidatus Thalassarchaeum sp.]|nr:hypothetical protein [Candidatus Thalassarchaeum sp.]